MNLEELRDNPAVKEHWPQISRPVLAFLDTLLIESAIGAECEGRAQAEAAVTKVIAKLIRDFRSLANEAPKPTPARTRRYR